MQIDIINLAKRFGDKTAVCVPEFRIGKSEIIGLAGNNGAGKTTLFRLMLDLTKPKDGEIMMTTNEGRKINPAKSEEWKSVVGAFLDDSFLIDFLTPEEYFDFIGQICRIDKQAIQTRLASFATFTGNEITGQKKLIRDFSAGNKQKIGIIAALIGMPQLLILDEPFNFLDPSSQNILKSILTEYNAKTGATIIISSHNLQHIADISSRIALLENGRIIKDLNNENKNARPELEQYFTVTDS